MIKMTTTQSQAEFLSEIMEELEQDPEYPESEKEILRQGYKFIKPILNPVRITAGYKDDYYYIKISKDMPLANLDPLLKAGYKLYFLEPPFCKW